MNPHILIMLPHLLTQSQFYFIYTPLTSLLPYYFEANLVNQPLETHSEIYMNKISILTYRVLKFSVSYKFAFIVCFFAKIYKERNKDG